MKQTSTINKTIVMVAVLVLFTGASVGASIEEFAAPTYAEEDPYQGAVDDTTDEKDWRAIESNDKGIEKGAKNFFTKIMPNRMDDRLEDRMSHLEERIEVGQEIVIAYQFCIDSEDCEVDAKVLEEMIDNLNTKHSDMLEKINSDTNELSEEEVTRFTEREDSDIEDEEDDTVDESSDDDSSKEECEETGGTWSEDRQVCYEEDADICIWEDEDGVIRYGCEEDKGDDVWFDCRTEEVWSDEKQEWCDLEQKKAFSDDKAVLLESGRIAISFCIVSEECNADQEKLREVLAHMLHRHEIHRDCTEDERCERDKQDRRGLFDRLHDTIRKDKKDTKPLPTTHTDIGEETCNERGGEWIEVNDRDKDFAFCNFWLSPDGADCLEEGGTWSEERRVCYHAYDEDSEREE